MNLGAMGGLAALSQVKSQEKSTSDDKQAAT
jgi:hypothetical protein